MPTPKPTAAQHETVQLLHKKCGFDVGKIVAIAEVARLRSKADYERYICALNCYQLFMRLEMDAKAQTALIRECGGEKLWTLNKHKVARLYQKLTVRLSDEIPQLREKKQKYMVQTLSMSACVSLSDQKAAFDLAGRYGAPGTVNALYENGQLVALFANGTRMEVTKMDMSY